MSEKTIKIGPQVFKYLIIENLKNNKGDGVSGYISFNQSEIQIDSDQDNFSKRVTLWHEILHGILVQSAAKKHDESIIDALSYGIVQVLDDNEGKV